MLLPQQDPVKAEGRAPHGYWESETVSMRHLWFMAFHVKVRPSIYTRIHASSHEPHARSICMNSGVRDWLWFPMGLKQLPLMLLGCWGGWGAKLTPEDPRISEVWKPWSVRKLTSLVALLPSKPGKLVQKSGEHQVAKRVCKAATQERIYIFVEVPPSRIKVTRRKVRWPHVWLS